MYIYTLNMQLHTTPYDSMLMTYWSKLRSNDEVFRNWNDEIPICGSCIVFPFFLPRCSLTFGKVGPLLRPALCVCDLNPALIHKTRAYIRQSHRIFSMIFHQKTSRVGYLLFFQSQFLRNSGVRVLLSLRVTSGTSFPESYGGLMKYLYFAECIV